MTTAVQSKKRLRFELNMDEGWTTLIFVSLMTIIVTGSITEAGYDDELGGLILITLGALVSGLFLAKSHLPGILAHLFSLIYSIAWNAFIISYQLPDTFTAREKLLEMGYRIAAWVQDSVLGGELGTDPLMFTVVMCLLSWLLTYLAMWFSFRVHVWWATLLPLCITLTINLYYGPDRIGFFIVPFVLLALLYTTRLTLFLYQRGWRKDRVRFGPDMSYAFLRYGTILALIAIVLAWVIPTAARNDEVEVFVSRFTEPWDRLKGEWIRLFSTLRSERPLPTYASFGASLDLGGPVSLGNITVMDVQSPTGRYWRAATYDQYDGKGWTIASTDTVFLDAGEEVGEMVPYEARRVITHTFTVYMPGTNQVFALGQAERFSLPVRADYIAEPSETDIPQIDTVVMASSRAKFKDIQSYMAVSTVASADVDAMRQAGENYPDWIVERYLQLPDTVPQRVHDLAQEITEGYDNAFDKATAIERYLREYPYNDKIAMPPPNVQDRVDYFLFEIREGYCNYYSSAMTVLARSAGIPARVAAGYARGEYDEDSASYRVRESDSHAWTEIYLPRFGWLEFEPTAGEPVIVRPRSARGDQPPSDDDRFYWEDYMENIPEDAMEGGGITDPEAFAAYLAQQQREQRIQTTIRISIIVAVSALIIGGAWWLGRRRMNEERPAHTYYEHMIRQARMGGLQMLPAQTPNEFGRTLSGSLDDDESGKLVDRITDAYVYERFGHKNPSRYQPDFAWRDLRPILLRWGIGQRWRQLWKRNKS